MPVLDKTDWAGHVAGDNIGVDCNHLHHPGVDLLATEGFMDFNAKAIDRIGKLLFGPRYVSELARALGVSRITVVSWVAGEWKPSEDNAKALRNLITKRVAALQKELK